MLVSLGGADTQGETARVAAAAHDAVGDADVIVVRGPHAPIPDLPTGVTATGPLPGLGDELAAADLYVGAAGQTMLEAAALGTPALVAVVAANQTVGAQELASKGGVELFDPADPEALGQRIAALSDDFAARSRMSAAGQAAVDGQGARRIAAAIARLAD